MVYYRAKKEFDNRRFFVNHEWHSIIGDELLTKEEFESSPFVAVKSAFEIVELNPENIHFFFGKRFEN